MLFSGKSYLVLPISLIGCLFCCGIGGGRALRYSQGLIRARGAMAKDVGS